VKVLRAILGGLATALIATLPILGFLVLGHLGTVCGLVAVVTIEWKLAPLAALAKPPPPRAEVAAAALALVRHRFGGMLLDLPTKNLGVLSTVATACIILLVVSSDGMLLGDGDEAGTGRSYSVVGKNPRVPLEAGDPATAEGDDDVSPEPRDDGGGHKKSSLPKSRPPDDSIVRTLEARIERRCQTLGNLRMTLRWMVATDGHVVAPTVEGSAEQASCATKILRRTRFRPRKETTSMVLELR
jgi:hypothetical protein